MSSTIPQRFKVGPILRTLGALHMRLFGWKVVGEIPVGIRAVAPIAHHTSNWDFIHILAASFYFGINPYFLAKHTLFSGISGWIMRKVGGIPVDRRSHHNVVDQVVEALGPLDEFILGITPEGTRSPCPGWKSGFYHMAIGTKAKLMLVFIDYEKKELGVGLILEPTGDIDADMTVMRSFYTGVHGANPENQAPVCIIKPKSE